MVHFTHFPPGQPDNNRGGVIPPLYRQNQPDNNRGGSQGPNSQNEMTTAPSAPASSSADSKKKPINVYVVEPPVDTFKGLGNAFSGATFK